MPNKSVVTTDFPQDREMVHVFKSNESNAVKLKKDAIGDWVMPKSEITRADGTLMSPIEIKEKFSLPEVPTHIVDVKPDRTVRATVSTSAGKQPENGGASNHFGEGGGQQWRIQENVEDLPSDWFHNPRVIK